MPFWLTATIVCAQCALTIATAVIDRSKMESGPKHAFQAAIIGLAVLGMSATLTSSVKNRLRLARLEAVAPNENDLGELVFRGEPLEGGAHEEMSARGISVPALILRTPKSVLGDRCHAALQAGRYEEALEAAHAALKLEPGFEFVRAHRAMLLAQKGDLRLAQDDARWVSKRSKHPRLREAMAVILKRRCRKESVHPAAWQQPRVEVC